METNPILYAQTHHYSSASSSPPPPQTDFSRLRHHQQNVRGRYDLAMPISDLTVRRVIANRNNFRFNQATESVSIAAIDPHRAMAEERKKGEDTAAAMSAGKSADEKSKASEKSAPAVPPPEKPLPGDCCGSGCVRCVWDVYYEELDEYNKLQNADSKV